AGGPEAAGGVGDDGVAGGGQLVGLGQVLEVVEAPAVDEHDRRVAAGGGGLVDVRLEHHAVGGGDVDEPDAGGRGGGRDGRDGGGGNQTNEDGQRAAVCHIHST